MNRALISSSLIVAFLLVACDKPPAGGAAPGTSPSPSTAVTPPSPASAASN